MLIHRAIDCFEQWLAAKYAKRTVYIYRRHIRHFLRFVDRKETHEISLMDIVAWNAKLKENGLGDNSVAHAMIAIRRFFYFLYTIRASTLDYRAIPIPTYTQNSFKPAGTDDAAEMLERVDPHSKTSVRDKAIIAFLYASGLRVSELTDLRLENIIGKERATTIISKKNRQGRMVFWDERAQQLLQEYLADRPYGKSDYLFVSYAMKCKGEKMTTRSVERVIAAYRPRGDISPHSFRHGLGMRAVKSGLHPRYIQKILGHKSIASSQVYMDVCDPDVKNAYQMIKNG